MALTPPNTTVGLPSNGAILSGGQWLDASASDNLGVTQVNYVLNGGTYTDTVISGSTPTYVGWIGGWNTTTVPDGTYTLQSVAIDVEGFSATSPPVTVVVNNQPPTTSVIIPSDGATQSGGAALLDAVASANVRNVKFELSGGTLSDQVISGAAPTLYGWLGQWNTTTVPNGTYTLQSVATNIDGAMVTSAPITVTVANPPPSTAVIIPSSGATQSGAAALLDAVASANVTSVSYELSGGTLSDQVISGAAPTLYGWLGQWNTTTVPNGTYMLQSVASYAGGVSGTSPPVTITVNN